MSEDLKHIKRIAGLISKNHRDKISNWECQELMQWCDLSDNTLIEKPGDVTFNALTTPTAGQFQVTLPDGSKVWLNNASSLRYPVAFTGKDREVELKGEAYFEIEHNATMPFKVKVGEKMLVNALGTSFNIAPYGDESLVKTTLLTGAVRVSEGSVSF